MGDSRERYPTYRALAADGGQAPVALESGKSKRARFRWACDHRLREAISTLAESSPHHNSGPPTSLRAPAPEAPPTNTRPHPRPRLVVLP